MTKLPHLVLTWHKAVLANSEKGTCIIMSPLKGGTNIQPFLDKYRLQLFCHPLLKKFAKVQAYTPSSNVAKTFLFQLTFNS